MRRFMLPRRVVRGALGAALALVAVQGAGVLLAPHGRVVSDAVAQSPPPLDHFSVLPGARRVGLPAFPRHSAPAHQGRLRRVALGGHQAQPPLQSGERRGQRPERPDAHRASRGVPDQARARDGQVRQAPEPDGWSTSSASSRSTSSSPSVCWCRAPRAWPAHRRNRVRRSRIISPATRSAPRPAPRSSFR